MKETISIPMPEQVQEAVAAIRKGWDEAERQRRRRIGVARQLDLVRIMFAEEMSESA